MYIYIYIYILFIIYIYFYLLKIFFVLNANSAMKWPAEEKIPEQKKKCQ